MNYFTEDLLEKTKIQKKKTLIKYFIVLSIYAVIMAGLLIWFTTFTYKDPKIALVKFILHTLNFLMVFFSFVYLGIVYKRVNSFYKVLNNMKIGIRETYVAEFIGYDELSYTNAGVEYKTLLFKEWNKYKKDYYERKVLVFNELPFPEIETGKMVKFITQSNVLVEYEYITENN